MLPELELDQLVLRHCRQVIMQAMDHVRSRMREENLPALRRIPVILAEVGLRLLVGTPTHQAQSAVRQHIEYHLELLANAEHQAWMKWHFENGWTYHPVRDDKKRRHNLLIPFTKLKEADKNKDREQVRHYPEFAERAGYQIAFVK